MLYRPIYRQKKFRITFLLFLLLSFSGVVYAWTSYVPETIVVHVEDSYTCDFVVLEVPQGTFRDLTCDYELTTVHIRDFPGYTTYYLLGQMQLTRVDHEVPVEVFVIPEARALDGGYSTRPTFEIHAGAEDSAEKVMTAGQTMHILVQLGDPSYSTVPAQNVTFGADFSFTIYFTHPSFLRMHGGKILLGLLTLLALPSLAESVHKFMHNRENPPEPRIDREVRDHFKY